MANTNKARAGINISGRGLVAYFISYLFLKNNIKARILPIERYPAISYNSMGIVSPTVSLKKLRPLYKKEYQNFIKEYELFITGRSFRISKNKLKLKKNSTTVDVPKMLSTLYSTKPYDRPEWKIETGRNVNAKYCETYIIKDRYKYPKRLEGCSFAYIHSSVDIYYKFHKGCIYFGADSKNIKKKFQELFGRPTKKCAVKYKIPIRDLGIPYVSVSIHKNTIKTGNTGTHGILSAYIVAKQIVDYVLYGTDIRSEFLKM